MAVRSLILRTQVKKLRSILKDVNAAIADFSTREKALEEALENAKTDEETDKVHSRATIMVERDSQKGIIIGKKGAMLKKIGSLARRDIELMLGDKVYLETWVKVKKNWRDKKLDLADFGYNKKEY